MPSRFCHVPLCATPWTVAHQAPLSMGFSRREHWSGKPCCLPGDLPDPCVKPTFLKSNLRSPPGKPLGTLNVEYKNFPLFYLKRTCIWLLLLMVSRRLNKQSEWSGWVFAVHFRIEEVNIKY